LIVILCSALAILLLTRPALATIYMVNSTLDLPDGDIGDGVCATAPPGSVCTLRAAVMQANAHTGPDYITMPAGTYVLTRVGVDATLCGQSGRHRINHQGAAERPSLTPTGL
jgi:hypothetical protein